jgi:hypothetical protein
LSQNEPRFKQPDEAELEKRLEPRFREYEEWRRAQLESQPEGAVTASEPAKQEKKGFGKTDVIFLILGVAVAMLWKQCSAP